MIYMRNFFPEMTSLKLKQLNTWTCLKHEQISESITVTKDAVTGFLKRQLEKGNLEAVKDVLKGKPMTRAGKFLMQELRGKVISSLMLRLGLRRMAAVAIAMLLLPLIIAKVSGQIIEKINS
jgi:hypothetical protein